MQEKINYKTRITINKYGFLLKFKIEKDGDYLLVELDPNFY
jgi:hypothetical protein